MSVRVACPKCVPCVCQLCPPTGLGTRPCAMPISSSPRKHAHLFRTRHLTNTSSRGHSRLGGAVMQLTWVVVRDGFDCAHAVSTRLRVGVLGGVGDGGERIHVVFCDCGWVDAWVSAVRCGYGVGRVFRCRLLLVQHRFPALGLKPSFWTKQRPRCVIPGPRPRNPETSHEIFPEHVWQLQCWLFVFVLFVVALALDEDSSHRDCATKRASLCISGPPVCNIVEHDFGRSLKAETHVL